MYKSAVPRYDALDTLRGLGALIVLFFHTLVLNEAFLEVYRSAFYWSPLRMFFSGRQPVILFFVLSGFALFLMFESLENRVSKAPLAFIVSRIVRFYPVYLFSLLLSLCIYWSLREAGNTQYSIDAWNYIIHFNVEGKDVLDHLSLVGIFNTGRYNAPIWSIVVEMRVTLLFPWMYILVKRAGAVFLVAGLLVSFAVAWVFYFFEKGTVDHLLLMTLHYATLFVFGAMLAKHRFSVIEFIGRPSKRGVAGILIVSLVLYIYPTGFGWPIWLSILGDLLIGIGSCGLMAIALCFPRFFTSLRLDWFGRISFSLYLVHLPCLVAVYTLLNGSLATPWINVVGIAVSIGVAAMTWRWVELPSLNWSRAVRLRNVTKKTSIVGV